MLGKPHLEQDQIRGALWARVAPLSLWVRPLERIGNDTPRGMTVALPC